MKSAPAPRQDPVQTSDRLRLVGRDPDLAPTVPPLAGALDRLRVAKPPAALAARSGRCVACWDRGWLAALAALEAELG